MEIIKDMFGFADDVKKAKKKPKNKARKNAPKGSHYMSDGTLMKDSDMKKKPTKKDKKPKKPKGMPYTPNKPKKKMPIKGNVIGISKYDKNKKNKK
tara:strand:- start:377 stop:664 length:288 start_codon:yes stop_codon:yes gene_type:complete